nr:Rmf/CrpP family protein [Methylobacterium sp. PvP109]
METRQVNVLTIIAEGVRARTLGRPKDACPYPAGSPERTAWKATMARLSRIAQTRR